MPSMLDIQHVLLMMLENRSFDHYLGALTLEGRVDVDGIPTPAPSNPSDAGPPIPMTQLETASGPVAIDGKRYFDPPHEYVEVASQLNGQGMDGFVTAYEKKYKRRKSDPPDRARHVMGYYTRQTLPVLYALADEFVVCDRWFSSFAGSTWPNRVYTLAGDADELIGTGFKEIPDETADVRALFLWASVGISRLRIGGACGCSGAAGRSRFPTPRIRSHCKP
jgi:phospholipase C